MQPSILTERDKSMWNINVKCVLPFSIALIFALGSCDLISPPESRRGESWVFFTKANSPLVGDTINAISMNPAGEMLIATTNGANKFSRGQWLVFQETLRYNTPLGASRNVLAVTSGRDKSIWFGLAGGGVKRYNPSNSNGEQWVTYRVPTINADFVYSLAGDPSGSVWIGTSSGVTRFIQDLADPTRGIWFKYTSSNSPIPDEQIRCAGVNPADNVIWFGTQSRGVVSFDGDLVWSIDQPNDAPFPMVAISFGKLNDIWFGTFADWSYRYQLKTYEWSHYADTSGLGNNFVNAVAVGADQDVWFGTNNGLVLLRNYSYSRFTRVNSRIPSDTITALVLDFDEDLWIGTTSGIAEYNPNGTK